MSGASDSTSGVHVSSWGWSNGEGGAVAPGADPVFRRWSVSDSTGERRLMLLLPVDMCAVDALGVACDVFSDSNLRDAHGWKIKVDE